MTNRSVPGKIHLLAIDSSNRPTLFAASFQAEDYKQNGVGIRSALFDEETMGGTIVGLNLPSAISVDILSYHKHFISKLLPIPGIEKPGLLGFNTLGEFTPDNNVIMIGSPILPISLENYLLNSNTLGDIILN